MSTYPLKPGDSLAQGTCGHCGDIIDLTDLGFAEGLYGQGRNQKLIYYRNLEHDEVPFVWNSNKPARYLPFCGAECSAKYYEEKVRSISSSSSSSSSPRAVPSSLSASSSPPS